MPAVTTLHSGSILVFDYRCTATPNDTPFPEVHRYHSVSYVRKGSFGCRSRGRTFELVAGAVLVGHANDEYTCTHDHHHGGDECLSFQLTPELVESIGFHTSAWRVGSVPPTAELMVLGELAQVTAAGQSDLGMDEVGMMFVHRFMKTVSGYERTLVKTRPQDRRRIVETALWIADNAQQRLDLDAMARQAGLSSFHFLRSFRNVLGVTPHQYLVRCRQRLAVRLLADDSRSVTDVAFDAGFADLSNFVRTFQRTAGTSPGRFRRAIKGDRKIFQDLLARLS